MMGGWALDSLRTSLSAVANGLTQFVIAEEDKSLDCPEVSLGFLVKGSESPHPSDCPSESIESGRDVTCDRLEGTPARVRVELLDPVRMLTEDLSLDGLPSPIGVDLGGGMVFG